MNYQHRFIDGSRSILPVGKVVCVGRNYAEHAKELNNAIPTEPLLFIKPSTALCELSQPIVLPKYSQACHHEIELAVLIGKKLSSTSSKEIKSAIIGYGLALDLTLRDVQQRLKQEGQPWEKAKAFDGSCPISAFIRCDESLDLNHLSFSLTVNEQLKQQGDTRNMLWAIEDLIGHISEYFTLLPGDVVLTGTPSGVGCLNPNDSLILQLEEYQFKTCVKP